MEVRMFTIVKPAGGKTAFVGRQVFHQQGQSMLPKLKTQTPPSTRS